MAHSGRLSLRRGFWLSRNAIVNWLRLVWVAIIVFGEVGVYRWTLSSCKWPDSDLNSSSPPSHILLVSDAQLKTPSNLHPGRSWLTTLYYFIYELHLRRAWRAALSLEPEHTIFLGDMLADGKRLSSEDQYKEYVTRFKSVFAAPPSSHTYFIPGNNDVGMGLSLPPTSTIRQYYLHTFGAFNQVITVRDHLLAMIDAPGLVDEDYLRSAQGFTFEQWTPPPNGTVDFIKGLPRGENPVILFSHIPLSRPDTASCGQFREHGTIRRGVGHGYQNTLGKDSTTFLLEQLHPSMIFSGDNRDFCEYYHPMPSSVSRQGAIKEVTVKSFSMARQIRQPGLHLLSLIDPVSPPQITFAETACHLPNQFRMFTHFYQPLLLLTWFALLLYNWKLSKRPPDLSLEDLPLCRSESASRSPSPLPSEPSIWAISPSPVSPRGTLPTTIRTPNPHSDPTQRTASRPGTPLLSPLFTPIIYHQEDEDEDPMYPAQYATRRSNVSSQDWSPNGQMNFLSESSNVGRTYFMAGAAPPQKYLFSYMFSFMGQRRRITVHYPSFSWTALGNFISLFEGSSDSYSSRRRGVIVNSLIDGLRIVWTIVLIWVLLIWWTY